MPPHCQVFLEHGFCRDLSCQKKHNVRKCTCDLVLSAVYYQDHQRGRRHRELLRAKMQQGIPQTEPREISVEEQDSGNVVADDFISVKAERRRRQQHQANFIAVVDDAKADKGGIAVSGIQGIDFGIIEPGDQPFTVILKIKKINREAKIALAKYRLASSVDGSQNESRFTAQLVGPSRWMTKKARHIYLQFPQTSIYQGLYEDTLEMLFHDVATDKDYVIIRSIAATVGSRNDQEELKPVAPYVPRRRERLAPPTQVVLSTRPPMWSGPQFKKFLPSYDSPEDILEAAYGKDGRPSVSTQEFRQNFMPATLNIRTYTQAFRVPLYVEEEKLKQDLDQYALFEVTLSAHHPRYHLEVKGLAEGRPSVLMGDYVLVKHSDSAEDRWFQGRVHEVYANHVSLHFGDEFSTYRGTKFDVRFQLNRIPHRRMHDAIKAVKGWHSRILFPTPDKVKAMSKPAGSQIMAIAPINRLVGKNDQQMKTICAIMNLPPGSPPFIVFGPPGTGKTVTIVEAIRQLLIRDPSLKILVCAPSNSAADLAATKLTDLGPSTLLRLNALSRTFSSLPVDLQSFSSYNDSNIFQIPLKEDFEKYRVVVSTCLSGGVAAGLGVKKGHFGYIFIDEAGQAKEPECMVPVLSLADDKTNLVLAGDNKQLGPVLHSPLAGALGLKVSWLARMMDRPLYDMHDESVDCPGKDLVIVKLTQHFRSHPSILKFPNSTFYNNELQPCGDVVITQSLERWEELPTKGFPVIFYGIIGKDQREASSPSYFNAEEATIVRNYCESLLGNRKLRIEPKDIGVITPYHTQRCKIGQLFAKSKKLKLSDIKIGSVEEFQGQERKVIVLSTVRSSDENVMADIRRNLGFVAEPRRFNVAITRARSLLIIVGNPIILSLDPIWRSFLNYIHTCGGWLGKAINWDTSEPIRRGPDEYAGEMRQRVETQQEEMMARLKALIMRVERSDGFVLDEDDIEPPEDGEDDDDDFVPERGTFFREDE